MKTRSQARRQIEQDPRVVVNKVPTRLVAVLEAELFGTVPANIDGAILWFKVPPGTPSESVQAYAAALLERGAVRAKAWEQAVADAALPEATVSAESGATAVREIVAELVAVLPNDVRGEASEIVEAALSKAGV